MGFASDNDDRNTGYNAGTMGYGGSGRTSSNYGSGSNSAGTNRSGAAGQNAGASSRSSASAGPSNASRSASASAANSRSSAGANSAGASRGPSSASRSASAAASQSRSSGGTNSAGASRGPSTASRTAAGALNGSRYGGGTSIRDRAAAPFGSNFRGPLGPNGELRVGVTPSTRNYQNAEIARAAYPNSFGKYSQTQVTNFMDRLAQVAPPEAYTNRWGTSPLGSISRVAINQVLGGRSLKSAIGALDSAKERIGTKNLTTQGLAEPGTHLHTLSQMAIQDAMMGRGVYDPAVNASNFTAGPRPTNISKTAKSAWNTTPLGTYKGTTYRSDPAYGDKIASANQLASSIINGTAVSSPSVPDVQVASVDPRGSLSVANRAAMGRPAGLGMDPRGSISVADRAAAGKPAAPGSLDARIAAAQAAMPNVHASSIPSPMEQVANPTSAPPPSSPMLVGQIEGNRIVGRYGPVGKIQDRIASAPGLGPGLMAAPDVNLGASKGLSAAVSPEKPQNFADSFLGQGLSTIGNGIVDGVNAFNDGMRQFNQHKGKLSFANAIGINPIGDAVKDAASGGIRSLQNSIASMMNGVSSSPNVQVASTPSPQQETNTMPNRNPLVGGVRAPAVNNHPASGTLASIMGGANAGDAAATVAALSSGKLEHQQRLAARAARPGHSTPIPPVTTPPGTTPVPGTPPAPFAFDFSPIQAMFAKLAAGIDPATGKSIYNSKGKSKA